MRDIQRWLWILALLFVLSLAAASVWMDWRAREVIGQQELNRVRARAETLATLVDREMENTKTVLLSIESREPFRQAWIRRDFDSMRPHLQEALHLERSFLFVSAYETDGTLRTGWNSNLGNVPDLSIVGKNFAQRDWYRGVSGQWQPYVSEVFRAASTPSPLVVAVAVPIHNPDGGEPIGILMASCTLAKLTDKFRSLDLGGGAYVVDQRGVVAASTEIESLGQPLQLSSDLPLRAGYAGQAGSTTLRGKQGDSFAGYAAVGQLKWVMIYARPVGESLRPAILLRRFGVSAAGFLLLIYVVTMGFALNLVRKQSALLAANQSLNEALQVAREHLEKRVRERTAELLQTNRDLLNSQERYRTVVQTATDAILTIDGESNILFANPAVARVFGYAPEEIRGRKLTMLMPEYLRRIHEAGIRRYLDTGHRHINWDGIELPGLHKLGHEIPLEVSFEEFRSDGQHVFTGFVRDISQRKRAEKALRESEQQYRLLFDSNPHPMWIFDPESLVFLAVNDAAIHHYGYSREEFLAMTIKDIRPPEAIPALLADVEAHHTGHDAAGIWKHKKKDGSLIDVEISAHEILWLDRPAKLVLAQDITERQQLQKQLLQSQKMEAVGHLAGGIAHDFNNLLGVILGYCELLLMAPSQGSSPANTQLTEIKKAGERAATLTRQLLAFSRKQIVEPVVFDLNGLVADMGKMLHRLIGEDVQLVTLLEPKLGRIKADPGQVEQVVMNLAVNARDAMPQGGKLTIETANVELDEEYARKHLSVVPGSYVLLVVSDTGAGMDEATLARIFEPFFTTKPAGKGTGLGLATVYGIVKQSGGNIWVYSEPDKGTSFKIYIPRVSTPVTAARLREAGAAPGGTETVLVVEDAEAMRKMACEFLATRGYTVLQARDGVEALELGKKNANPIHLLLTDVVMPGMSGRELAERMTAHYPGLKVLFMSGYTGDAVVRHGILEGESAFIQKPFTLHGLATKVRETLDSATSPGQ